MPIPISITQRGSRLSGGTIGRVSVFKRQPGSHMHVRTPVTAGVVVLLVILLSAFCFYRVGAL